MPTKKVVCPVCKENVDFDHNEYEEGDFFECPECGELLTVEVKKGKVKLVTDQEKKLEEMEEIEEDLELEEEE